MGSPPSLTTPFYIVIDLIRRHEAWQITVQSLDIPLESVQKVERSEHEPENKVERVSLAIANNGAKRRETFNGLLDTDLSFVFISSTREDVSDAKAAISTMGVPRSARTRGDGKIR
jgi:hypothetical protein